MFIGYISSPIMKIDMKTETWLSCSKFVWTFSLWILEFFVSIIQVLSQELSVNNLQWDKNHGLESKTTLCFLHHEGLEARSKMMTEMNTAYWCTCLTPLPPSSCCHRQMPNSLWTNNVPQTMLCCVVISSIDDSIMESLFEGRPTERKVETDFLSVWFIP